MKIIVNYVPTAKELSKASSLFIEKKTFLLFAVGLINILAGLLLIIMVLKLFVLGLTLKESVAGLVGIGWIFGRRPFNEWLLLTKMKRSKIINQPIRIEISRNGIVWSGKGLQPGNMGWDIVKYVLGAQNGFVLPYNPTQFLWLPMHGFKSPAEVEEFKNLIVEKKIVYRPFLKWKC